MTDCLVCQQVQKKTGVLYEDEELVALLSPTPAIAGHVILAPKQHYVIVEQVPDWVMGKLFTTANKLSIALFEGMGCHGTNLVVPNGEPAGQAIAHVTVQVVPRMENDGINLLWKPRQLSEEEMSTIELRVKEETKSILSFEKEAPKEQPQEELPTKEEPALAPEENEMIKALRRIP